MPALGESPSYYAIEVVEMDEPMVRIWCSQVQPRIDAQYGAWPDEHDPRLIRADVHWNWRTILRYAQLHNFASRLPGNRSGKAIAWCLTLVGDSLERMPIGMLTVVPEFHCTLAQVTGNRSFIWFLSDAPGEWYLDLGIQPARGVAKVLIDTALQTRIDLGLDAACLLHADPSGGDKLLNFYEHSCGMVRVDGSNRVSPLRPMRLGEYFQMDDAQARDFCSKLDSNRMLEVN